MEVTTGFSFHRRGRCQSWLTSASPFTVQGQRSGLAPFILRGDCFRRCKLLKTSSCRFCCTDVSGKEDGGLTYQQIGLAKLRGVREWLGGNVGLTPTKEEGAEPPPKIIIFAHHIEVLDRIQVRILDYLRFDLHLPLEAPRSRLQSPGERHLMLFANAPCFELMSIDHDLR